MVRKAMKFTPEVMLSAPRRSAGIPNPPGDTLIYTTSTYSFETHQKASELRVADVQSGNGREVVKDKEVSDLHWLDDDNFVFLCAEKHDVTTLCVGSVPWHRTGSSEATRSNVYVAGMIDAPAANLKVTKWMSEDGHGFAVVFSAKAAADGSLFNPEKAKKPRSTGRLYSSLYVRHWDTYDTNEKNALWYGKLSKGSGGKYKLSNLINVLEGTGLECPTPPFGGTNEFDIYGNCIIFVAKDSDLDPAINTKSNVYVARIWDVGPSPTLERVVIRDFEGASTSPVISPDGSKAAFLSMQTNGYEADRNEIFLLWPLHGSGLTAKRLLSNRTQNEWTWDRSPSSIRFSADGKSLLALADDCGCTKLFTFSADLALPSNIRALTSTGAVSDVRPLSNGNVFISGSTLIDNSFYAIVDPLQSPEKARSSDDLITWFNSNSSHGSKFGLRPCQVSSIWTPASNQNVLEEIHSLIIKPSNFDSSKTYPVAYFIHGGPQGSWVDGWSTRWNLAVFAEQGYIVVAPNPTGSTGYGQDFTDDIRDNWGGDPYQDIVNCFEWVGENLKGADNDRAVALGGSYGGYMINWIQGHDLGRQLKALVCHDGSLSMAGMLATDEMYFLFREFGNTPWRDASQRHGKSNGAAQATDNVRSATFPDWRRWDPSEHFSEWATPELIIHSSNDYRIPIADGLAAFNVLQARGVDSQFLTFPDENHWVLKPENSLAWHKVVLNWINKHVGLPSFAPDDPERDEFWGGTRDEREDLVDMMTEGRLEM